MSQFLSELQACLPILWRYAYSLTRNRDAADDLVQDCVERALKKRDLWKPEGSLKSWLMTILLNIYRNQIRTCNNRPGSTAIDDLVIEPAATETLSGRLDLNDTARALQQLPDEQREVLLLIALGGMAYKEAAQSLGIPIGTLMSRLGRARANLRDILNGPATNEAQS